MKPITIKSTIGLVVCAVLLFTACEKYVDIDPPTNNLVASTAFETDGDVEANIAGLHSYNLLQSSYHDIYRHLYPGFSSDEILYYTSSNSIDQFIANAILTDNTASRYMWSEPYKAIYQSNLMLSALENATNVSSGLKDEAEGVAYFFRALSYLNLVSIFGDVPLVTETEVAITGSLPRSPKSEVYGLIIDDLTKAKALLAASNRGNVWATASAASALLARAYLYNEQWQEAVAEAGLVLSGSLGNSYALEDIEKVFIRGSSETIFAIGTDGSSRIAINHTYNGRYYVPSTTVRATYYLTEDFLDTFEEGDLRAAHWIRQFTLREPYNWYPYKYKLRAAPDDASLAEDQVLIRLAELYLIRAEANAQLNSTVAAIADLNAVRARAGLGELDASLSQAEVLLAVEQERRVELFSEYGHRWVDLVRTGRADAVLGAHKANWNSYGQLYPVPEKDIELNPNLAQNPGYGVQ